MDSMSITNFPLQYILLGMIHVTTSFRGMNEED